MAEQRLELVADGDSWWLRSPAGEPLDLHRFGVKTGETVQQLLSQRYALSKTLRQRIRRLDRNRAAACLCCQVVVGLVLPAGLLTQGEWDYDRDMDVLRKEAATVLSSFLPASGYELMEHIDSEAEFRDGKVLFYLYLR